MRRHCRKRLLVYILLIPTVVFLVLPILWLLVLSVRPNSVILKGIESITSTHFVLENYVTLFTQYNVLRYVLNSVIGAGVPAFISVLVGLLAGYALVRFRFRGRQFFYSLPLFAQTVPIIALVVPFYTLMLMLNTLNTYIAVILAHISLVLPLSVWMMTGYLRGVPPEIEEAAMVDGCSRLGAISRVVIPIAMPGIAATTVMSFLESWGEFLLAYVLTTSEDMRLLAVAVYTFIPGGMAPTTWGLLFALAAVFMAPSMLLFLLLQTSFKKGLALGVT